MKKALFIAFCFMLGGALKAQEIDLSAPSIVLHSHLNHMSGEAGFVGVKPPHETDEYYGKDTSIYIIEIQTKTKTVRIYNKVTGREKYNLKYSAAFQGANQSVQLKPSETLIMVRDTYVDVITHDAESATLSVMRKDGTIELFGKLERIDS